MSTVTMSTASLTTETQECLMGTKGCNDPVALWTVGLYGTCFNEQAGFKFGKGATKILSLQVTTKTSFRPISMYWMKSRKQHTIIPTIEKKRTPNNVLVHRHKKVFETITKKSYFYDNSKCIRECIRS